MAAQVLAQLTSLPRRKRACWRILLRAPSDSFPLSDYRLGQVITIHRKENAPALTKPPLWCKVREEELDEMAIQAHLYDGFGADHANVDLAQDMSCCGAKLSKQTLSMM